MKLRGGRPLWPILSPAHLKRGRLNRDVKCDVLVVGAGITGALVAYHLAEEGLRVVIVDRRNDIAEGSTPASTALLLYDLDTPLVKLRRRHGRRKSDAIYQCSRTILDDMSALVHRLELDCCLTRRLSLLLAAADDDVPELKREAAARKQLGLEADFLDSAILANRFHMKRPGGILSRVSLEMDPWRFTNQLLQAAERLGCRIFSKTTLCHLPGSGTSMVCRTDKGKMIEARHVVWATGYETPEQFPAVRRLSILNSTYVVATRPLAADQLWPQRALIWDTGDPYIYARTTADRRIIIGGEDESFVDPTLRDKLIPAKSKRLLRKFNSIYSLGELGLETAWAGTFASTADGLPYIGTMEEYPGCYFALGYGGNGITLSLVAAQIIRDAILGRKNPAASLFSFKRRSKEQRKQRSRDKLASNLCEPAMS